MGGGVCGICNDRAELHGNSVREEVMRIPRIIYCRISDGRPTNTRAPFMRRKKQLKNNRMICPSCGALHDRKDKLGKVTRCVRHRRSLSFILRAPIARFPRGRRSGRALICAGRHRSDLPAIAARRPAAAAPIRQAPRPPKTRVHARGNSRCVSCRQSPTRPNGGGGQIQRPPSHMRADQLS